MLTLQDELWIAENASFLCFGKENAMNLIKTVAGCSKSRIFLELLSHTDAIHKELIETKFITPQESAAVRQELTRYIKSTRF